MRTDPKIVNHRLKHLLSPLDVRLLPHAGGHSRREERARVVAGGEVVREQGFDGSRVLVVGRFDVGDGEGIERGSGGGEGHARVAGVGVGLCWYA